LKKVFLLVLALIALPIISGCTMKASMYPVSGPLVDSGQAKPIPVKYTYNGSGHGKITFYMPDGEVCEGEYTTVSDGEATTIFAYDQFSSYYGNGFSTSLKQHGQAIAYGNSGTVLQAEYFVDSMTFHGYGLAKDNKDNLFKLMW
jgi:hypothetical protein